MLIFYIGRGLLLFVSVADVFGLRWFICFAAWYLIFGRLGGGVPFWLLLLLCSVAHSRVPVAHLGHAPHIKPKYRICVPELTNAWND